MAPRITSFTPTNGVIGTSVTINGANFTGTSTVTFNGTAATTLTVNTPIKITATVPAGATTGKIAVTTPAGTAISSGSFAVKPTIAGFTPGSGAVGAQVTINGTAFTGATSVRINGFAAAFTVNPGGTQITMTVPGNATTGPIAVTTPAGTATSATSFTVAPRITSFTPAHGAIGASVAINGVNFTGATSVTFNGTPAPGHVVNSAVEDHGHGARGGKHREDRRHDARRHRDEHRYLHDPVTKQTGRRGALDRSAPRRPGWR